jgi:hypothetical protein
MTRLSAVACGALGLLALSCGGQEVPEETVEAAQTAQAEFDALAKQVAQSVAAVGQPLRTLNEDQMASVAALLVMTRAVAQSEQLGSSVLGEAVWGGLTGICPPLPEGDLRLGSCMDEHIAYASAMARCEEDGKTEQECDRETAGEMQATVMCEMGRIEELRQAIGRIPGRRWPPGPFPWPIDPGVAPVGGGPQPRGE